MARPKYSDDMVINRMEAILAAAMELLEAEGINGISLRKTAKLMGWSSTAIYRYFENKQDLITALRARAFRRMENRLKDAVKPNASGIENLKHISQAFFKAGQDRPELYELMFYEHKNEESSSYYEELSNAKNDSLNVCTDIVASAQHNGELPPHIDPLTTAHIFWINMHGLVSLDISNQLVMGRKANVLTDILIQNILGGLSHAQS